ncbi:Protein Spindly [Nowakowskiella sp. JEL0078]|nr:Protein Spindly [Nowakowskiella sp. JEL0078]
MADRNDNCKSPSFLDSPFAPSDSHRSHLSSSATSFTFSPIAGNISISAELTDHYDSNKRARSEYQAYISDLESEVALLRNKVDALSSELNAAHRSAAKCAKKAGGEESALREDLNLAGQRITELEEEKLKLIRDKTSLTKQLKGCNSNEDVKLLNDRLLAQLKQLENALKISEFGRLEAEKDAANNLEKAEIIAFRVEELEKESRQLDDYQSNLAEKDAKVEDLEFDLERSYEMIAKLKERLAVLEPVASTDEDPNLDHKTLFSEVDDRRVELEMEHKKLASNYDGLVKKYHFTMHREERLKSHISRLNMLSNGKSAEDRATLLQQALVQSQSENRYLSNKLESLENKVHESFLFTDQDPNRTAPDLEKQRSQAELIECLRLQVESFTEEVSSLRSELRTTQLLKLNETEKVHEAHVSLISKENMLGTIKAQYAQARFELDELKSKLKKKNTLSEIKVLKDISKSEQGTQTSQAQIEVIADVNQIPTALNVKIPHQNNETLVLKPITSLAKKMKLETNEEMEIQINSTPIDTTVPSSDNSFEMPFAETKGTMKILRKNDENEECRQQ